MTQSNKQTLPLNKCIHEALENYFAHIDGHKVSNLYQMVIEQVEAPLMKSIMNYTKNNQSEAASILGISRGTLRNKLKSYNLGR